jgi:hypothetical protein
MLTPKKRRYMKASSVSSRTGFNADPHLAFYLNADPDPDAGSQTNTDPDPCQTLKSQKETRKPCLFVNFGQFPYSWIRIRIRGPNTDQKQDLVQIFD